MRKREDRSTSGERSGPANPVLAERLKELGFAPAEPEAPAPERPSAPDAGEGAVELSRAGKIVLARERKGRGGKTVTLVRIPGLATDDLERLARSLRKALGCGAAVEAGAIVLQGDISPRARAWLQEHGARNVIQGN